jgi:YfiH family protein
MRSRRRPDDPYSGGNISFDVGDDPRNVLKARKALRTALGFSQWSELKQVHGQEVVFDFEIKGVEEPGQIEADGQAADLPGRALVIKTADCQPILVAHKDGKHILALHAGWKGGVAGLPCEGVKRFCRNYGLDPAECLAVRGPSLSPVAAEFINFDAEFGRSYESYLDRTTMTVDLWSLTRDQLMLAGIPERGIFGIDLCTFSNPETFFSYRRKKIGGRQAALIWIES